MAAIEVGTNRSPARDDRVLVLGRSSNQEFNSYASAIGTESTDSIGAVRASLLRSFLVEAGLLAAEASAERLEAVIWESVNYRQLDRGTNLNLGSLHLVVYAPARLQDMRTAFVMDLSLRSGPGFPPLFLLDGSGSEEMLRPQYLCRVGIPFEISLESAITGRREPLARLGDLVVQPTEVVRPYPSRLGEVAESFFGSKPLIATALVRWVRLRDECGLSDEQIRVDNGTLQPNQFWVFGDRARAVRPKSAKRPPELEDVYDPDEPFDCFVEALLTEEIATGVNPRIVDFEPGQHRTGKRLLRWLYDVVRRYPELLDIAKREELKT